MATTAPTVLRPFPLPRTGGAEVMPGQARLARSLADANPTAVICIDDRPVDKGKVPEDLAKILRINLRDPFTYIQVPGALPGVAATLHTWESMHGRNRRPLRKIAVDAGKAALPSYLLGFHYGCRAAGAATEVDNAIATQDPQILAGAKMVSDADDKLFDRVATTVTESGLYVVNRALLTPPSEGGVIPKNVPGFPLIESSHVANRLEYNRPAGDLLDVQAAWENGIPTYNASNNDWPGVFEQVLINDPEYDYVDNRTAAIDELVGIMAIRLAAVRGLLPHDVQFAQAA